MTLTKEWFDQRDKFIEEQAKLGNLTLEAALVELNATLAYLFDLGILTGREFTTASTNLTQLTPLGGLFFTEQCLQIFIEPTKLQKLQKALEDWDDFTIEYDVSDSNMVGQLSIRNQKHVNFQINGKLFQHSLKCRVGDTRNEMSIFLDNEDPTQLLSVWEDFCQCVSLIENQDKAPTNVEIVKDSEAIETLCAPWHKLVQRYFRSKMHQIGFEHNLMKLKQDIEQSYSISNTEWLPISHYFETVRPLRHNGVQFDTTDRDEETSVDFVTSKSIDEHGFVVPELIEESTRKTRSLRDCYQLQPDDALLFKGGDRKHVRVAYYSEQQTQNYVISSLFTVLRPKGDSHWNGNRLFLFLQTQVGQTLLEYTFRDFSVNEMAMHRLTPRQLNLLEIPQLSERQAEALDVRLAELLKLIQQRQKLQEQISLTLSANL